MHYSLKLKKKTLSQKFPTISTKSTRYDKITTDITRRSGKPLLFGYSIYDQVNEKYLHV